MTKVYRVENKLGDGMYCGNNSPASYAMIEEIRHPLPEQDLLLSPVWAKVPDSKKSSYVFGFVSLEQLKFWIYKEEWRKELNMEGFSVSVYDVKKVIPGDTQAVFLRQFYNKPIEKFSLLEI